LKVEGGKVDSTFAQQIFNARQRIQRPNAQTPAKRRL